LYALADRTEEEAEAVSASKMLIRLQDKLFKSRTPSSVVGRLLHCFWDDSMAVD
jgi:hypothetical protein